MKLFLCFFLCFGLTKQFLFCTPCDLDLNYPENSPLYFGNPSDATHDIQNEENFLIEKTGFIISYNNQKLTPNWVAWHLDSQDLGKTNRSNKFMQDKNLPENWYAVKKNDYKFPAFGFDRGHICPSADKTSSQKANEETFLMTNMIPQSPDCNRIVWKDFENYERELVLQGNELYIFAGGFGSGGIGNRGYFKEIPVYNDKSDKKIAINVPEFCWKIILVLQEGENDLERIDRNTQITCICVPNKTEIHKTGSWEQYKCSVNYIEEITNFDFFELLPDDLEDFLEN